MPYSGPDDARIPDNVPDGKKAQWVNVWNNTYNDCIDAGGSKSTCETKAFKVANGVIKKKKKRVIVTVPDTIYKEVEKSSSKGRSPIMSRGLFGAINDFIGNMKTALHTFQQRAVSVSNIGNAAWEHFYNQGAYMSDIYLENGELFAVANEGGKLFRATITVDNSGDITFGEMQEVIVKFDAVSRATFRTMEDGKVHMTSISATSVLNKDGQIDSRDLFDSMADYMLRTGKKIPRTLFHAGVEFRTGDIVFMGRDDNALVTVTEFDDSDIANREIKARETDADFWGDSIEFEPIGDPDLWDVGDGITIPVYRAGIPIAVSTLPAKYACSHYADRFSINKQEVNRMTLGTREREAFVKMFDGDEAAADEWLEANVSPVNRQIAETGQITRASDESTEVIEPKVEATEGETSEVTEEVAEGSVSVGSEVTELQPLVVELDDEMAQQVADTVVKSTVFTDFQASITDMLNAVKQTVSELTATVTELQAASVARAKEIQELKQGEDGKKKQWLSDLPRKTERKVTFRPSQDAAREDPAKKSLKEIAESTLANIKS